MREKEELCKGPVVGRNMVLYKRMKESYKDLNSDSKRPDRARNIGGL